MLEIRKKVVSTIKNLERAPNMNRLARLTDTTYSHQVAVINDLEELKIITSKKTGRTRRCVLTEKGQRIKELLYELEILWN